MPSDFDEFENFGEGIESLFSDTFGVSAGSLFDLGSRSLRPLSNLEVSEDTVTATFDLPGVKPQDVEIVCSEDTISVDAEMARPVKLRVPSGHYEQREFFRYSKKMILPVRVDPGRGSARFRNGIVVVKLPRHREGKPVRIEAGRTRGARQKLRRVQKELPVK